MGQCYGKNIAVDDVMDGLRMGSRAGVHQNGISSLKNMSNHASLSPWLNPFPHTMSPMPGALPPGVPPSPARSTPRRFFHRPFPPPSPAKHIKSSLVKRQGAPKQPKDGPISEDGAESKRPLDKSFGYSKNFTPKYELGHEVGHDHVGHTCYAKARKGEFKG